ncbi:glycosyltransferase [Sphingobacterium sp.]|uniref:glycosyltransferase n=1 Tax=Sphingobacterium sp. TaxID=341027 RepID=UPI0031D4C482
MTQNLLKNRIIFVTPSLSGGGAEKNLVNIINSLDDNSYSISLVIFYGNDNYLSFIDRELDVYKLNTSSVKNGVVKLKDVLDSIDPHIIFTSAEHILFFLTFYKIFNRKFQLVYRLPTLPSNKLYKGLKGKFLSFFTKSALRLCNYIICQTGEMKNEVQKYYKISPNKVLFIKNMVNVKQILQRASEYKPEIVKGTFTIVASGSLYSAKGFDYLIKAIKIVVEHKANVNVYILGEETVEKGYRGYLEALIAELGLCKCVKLMGFVKNPYPYYKVADLFVLSSIKEGFPNVVLEALVLGTPVVATDCVNFNGVIDKSNGVIVKKGDFVALSDAILSIKEGLMVDFKVSNFDYSNWFNNIINLK